MPGLTDSSNRELSPHSSRRRKLWLTKGSGPVDLRRACSDPLKPITIRLYSSHCPNAYAEPEFPWLIFQEFAVHWVYRRRAVADFSD